RPETSQITAAQRTVRQPGPTPPPGKPCDSHPLSAGKLSAVQKAQPIPLGCARSATAVRQNQDPFAGPLEFPSSFQSRPALVAQGIEHRSPKAGVARSNRAE